MRVRQRTEVFSIGFLAFLISVSAWGVRVDRIEISGVNAIDEKLVVDALENDRGQELNSAQIVRSSENIQRLYRRKGFEETSVRAELKKAKSRNQGSESVLEYVINEGRPTRVAEVSLKPVAEMSAEQKRHWDKILDSVTDGTGFDVGDVFDQEKITLSRRGILEALVTEEFAGAQVSDVKVTVTAAPLSVPAELQQNAFRWVRIEFLVDLGDRVTFGFRGNRYLTHEDLIALIDEQRMVGLGQDYVGAIRDRIIVEYKSLGFFRASIQPYLIEGKNSGERHVTFIINEGKRFRLKNIDFEGNHVFSSETLTQHFYRLAPRLTQNGYYSQAEVDRTLDLLIEWIQSKGHLSARLLTHQLMVSEEKSVVKELFYIFEGDQTLVRDIKFEGNAAFKDSEILDLLGNRPGFPLNLFGLNEGIENIKSSYRARGYLDFKIENEDSNSVVSYQFQNRQADIFLSFSEGRQFKVGQIRVEGLKRTDLDVVMRELQLKEGDFIRAEEVEASEGRLRRLGILSSAVIEFLDEPETEDRKTLRIVVQEASSGLVGGGIGIRNDLGPRAFGQYQIANLYGRNHMFFTDLAANKRAFTNDLCEPRFCLFEYTAQLGYQWPWFFVPELNFRPLIRTDRFHYRDFAASTVQIALAWDKRILKHVPLTGLFTYSLERIEEFNIKDKPGNQILRIGSIIPGLKLDYRDDQLAPTKGFQIVSSYEIADPRFFSQSEPFPVGYHRALIRYDYFHPLGFTNPILLYFSFRTGIEFSTIERKDPSRPITPETHLEESQGQIPLIKRFALGGSGSIRGFSEQDFNLKKVALFGRATFVNYRFQAELPVMGNVRFAPFVDAANLNVDQYSLGNLRYGVGAGIHIASPLGPVNFDWGFKVNPQGDEETYKFYFSIGVI